MHASMLALVALAMGLGPARLSAQTASADPAPPGAAGMDVLRPGDLVRVTVWRNPELSGEMVIAADSTLKHPLYRQVKIAGLPRVEAQDSLGRFLTQYANEPQVLLEPLLRVSVAGEVREPRLYSLVPETTVAQAVAQAGGPTADGRLNHVRIIRGKQVITADLTRPDGQWVQAWVQSGDQIFVTRRSSLFRDVVGPLASLAAAAAAIVTLATR